MSKPNQLFLLADHIKLSLLERQRAKTLNLESDAQDGHISRSLDQLRDGLSALKDEEARLRAAGDQRYARPGLPRHITITSSPPAPVPEHR
jgi:syntaxin 8